MLHIYRKCIYLFFALTFCCSAAQAQAISASQQSLVTKKTATWCSNCGSWGWNWFKDILETAPEQGGICLNLHSTNSSLKPTNNLDGEWLSQFSIIGNFPTFFVNGTHYSSVANILNEVEANHQSQPVAGVGLDAAMSSGLLQIRGRVQFFQPASGNYFLGFYLIEDSVVAQQSAQGANAIHRYIVREALQNQAFGEQIHEGMVSIDDSFHREVSQFFPGMSHERKYILSVLWNQVGGKYQYVNSWMGAISEGVLSTVQPAALSTWHVYPNPVRQGQVLTLESPHEAQSAVQIQLMSADGRQVYEQMVAAWPAELVLPARISPGTYYLRGEQGLLLQALQVVE